MKIIGIDPGYDRCGVAIIERATKDVLIFSCLIATNKKDMVEIRLAAISSELEKIMIEYSPDLLVLEQLFFSQNTTTALGVAEARGVILALAGKQTIPVRELGPGQIKLAITGYGKAEKSAVAQMVARLVILPDRKMIDDELDAIAIALSGSAIFGTEISTLSKK